MEKNGLKCNKVFLKHFKKGSKIVSNSDIFYVSENENIVSDIYILKCGINKLMSVESKR